MGKRREKRRLQQAIGLCRIPARRWVPDGGATVLPSFFSFLKLGGHGMRLPDKRCIVLDMDGTIYMGDNPIEGAVAFVQRHWEDVDFFFLSNNTSKAPETYIKKLNGMGITTGREDYLTSVDAAIDLLRRRYPGRRCYVQGTRSFYDQLAAAGIPVTCDREDGAEILLSGFDRELTFQKLEDACILLNRGVTWLATNPDWVCPTWYGAVPDCGSVCEMLHRATGREPEFIGKPRPPWYDWRWSGPGIRRRRRCCSATGCTRTSPAR